MLSRARRERAPGAAEERLAGIGRGRQRDQRGQPMEEVARLLASCRCVAGPHRDRQQHDVHRGKARDRQASHQPARLARLVGLGALRLERMAAIADVSSAVDDVARLERLLAPVDRQPAVGEVEPRLDDAGKLLQPALDLADAAAQPTPSTARSMCAGAVVIAARTCERSSASVMARPSIAGRRGCANGTARSPSRDRVR